MARRSRYLRYAEAVSMMREQDDETQKTAGKYGYHSSVLKRWKELREPAVKKTLEEQTTGTGGMNE